MQVHHLSADDARAAYSAAGLRLLPTYARPWRHRTGAEEVLLYAARATNPLDPDVRAQQGAWVQDAEARQLRLCMAELVAIRVPTPLSPSLDWRGNVVAGQQQPSPSLDAIHAHLVGAPAIESHDGASVVYLFAAAPGEPAPEVSFLAVVGEAGNERLAPAADDPDSGGVRLPHAGCREKWISGPGAKLSVLPEEWQPLTLKSSATVVPAQITDWLDRHYEKIGLLSSVSPTDRKTVYEQFLQVNGLLTSQINESTFGAACHEARCFDSKRTKHGIAWRIARKAGVPLAALPGVNIAATELADPVLLAEWRQWRATMAAHPARRRARAAAATAATVAAKEDGIITALFGDVATRDELGDIGYFAAHERFESQRARAAALDGEVFRPAWLGSDLGRDNPNKLRITPQMWAATAGLRSLRARYDAIIRLATEAAVAA